MAKHRDADDSDWAGLGEEKRRAGFEWGLASLLMGGLLALMALVMLITNVLLFFGAADKLDPASQSLATLVGLVGVVGVLVLCVISIVFGVRGVKRAQWFDTPTAVPLAGVLISIAATFLWLVVGADLIM